jgi:hypothetical protein
MYKANNFFAWILLIMFAILLMTMGIQGSLGKVFAVTFVPSELEVQ